MSKRATLLLIVISTMSSLIVVKAVPALAQPQPFVPEFTVKLVAHPYDVPTTCSIDPYTGENVTNPGFHVENKSIEITIRNQPFASNYYLFYNVRVKGHFEESWTGLYSYDHSSYSSGNLPPQSSSEYTVLSFSADYPPNAQVDFQVEALLWHFIEVWIADHPGVIGGGVNEIGHYEQRFTLGETSGWSNTQTMTFAAIPPNVTLLLPQDGNFSTSDVPLDFVVDQPVSQFKYSLDGQENVTVSGNATLTGLANGYHNVTVYATDEDGNTGASETLFFNVAVPEPFPVVPATVASVAAVAVAGAGLLLYFRKRRREAARA